MKRLLWMVAVTEEELGGLLGYAALAAAIYDVEHPSKTQISAVARAARRLEGYGIVEIYAWADDERQKVVACSHWAHSAVYLVETMELSFPETTSWMKQVSLTIEMLKDLAGLGIINVIAANETLDPKQRHLIIDGPKQPISEVLAEHPETWSDIDVGGNQQ